MRITVITVSYNASKSIEDTILSVASQNHHDVEHIVVDGGSTDGTRNIIEKHTDKLATWISEPDRGIYDAMNKGIAMSSGDVIGFLNADDVYAHQGVLTEVEKALGNEKIQACYADLVFLDNNKVVRHYRSSHFSPSRIAWGWMPAHPTLYVRRSVFDQFGGFKLDYQISADYEFVARVLGKGQIQAVYVPSIWVHMRTGGISTRNWKSRWVLNREIVRACCENDIYTNLFMVLSKFPLKILDVYKKL